MLPTASSRFEQDILEGLSGTQKAIPGKYLWDSEGSRLFEAITAEPAYYQTAAEAALTREALPEIADIVGGDACVVEFGSGASNKIRILLDALTRPACYVALDIAEDFLQEATRRLAADYPELEVHAVAADYSYSLPPLPIDRRRPVLGYLPGTSIGNMMPDSATVLLAQLRTILSSGFLLIGQDPNREPTSLQRAYEGPLMTALHLNVLTRLQQELGAELDMQAFRHESRTFENRVEPHLVATKATELTVAGRTFSLAEGESIQTDLSWKYTLEEFADVATGAGWGVRRLWADDRARFALYLLVA